MGLGKTSLCAWKNNLSMLFFISFILHNRENTLHSVHDTHCTWKQDMGRTRWILLASKPSFHEIVGIMSLLVEKNNTLFPYNKLPSQARKQASLTNIPSLFGGMPSFSHCLMCMPPPPWSGTSGHSFQGVGIHFTHTFLTLLLFMSFGLLLEHSLSHPSTLLYGIFLFFHICVLHV